MKNLNFVLAASFLLIINISVFGQRTNTNKAFLNNLNIDLLSSEILGINYLFLNEYKLLQLENKAAELPRLKDFGLSQSTNKLKFEDLLKEYKYYDREFNKNSEALNLVKKSTDGIQFPDSFWKSNMKMQYNNKYSSIGNWNFKVGSSF